MTNSEPKSNLISSLKVMEFETIITKIVQKVIGQENNRKKAEEEILQSLEIPNNSDYNNQTSRPFGLWRGQVQMSDDFDVLPESIAASFAGELE